jgi:hypothetical protein
MTEKSPRSAALATPPPESQLEKFQRLARELRCDEDDAAFKAKLVTIARQRPKATGTNGDGS